MSSIPDRLRMLTVVLALVLSTTACIGLPDTGPVVESTVEETRPGSTDAFYLPNPPKPGEEPTEIVVHFLEAMRANPVQTNVARQFLSVTARSSWDPERSTITYGDLTPASGSTVVQLSLRDANRLDERGVWTGPLPGRETTLRFPMVQEEGEWRIAEAPNALIVPESWFETQFRRVSLYFFDPTGQVLVPEPVFVPRGQQLATTLTRGLLRGPGEDLKDVSRTFFPGDAGLELSVPVGASGVAEVSLTGAAAPPSPEEVTLMLAQLAWTLRQEPSIRAIRLSVNGEPVSVPGGASEFRVSGGQEYAPTVSGASARMFGLVRGRLVEVDTDAVTRTSGPLGERGASLREVAVNLTARLAAGVSRGGRVVRVASLDESGSAVRTTVRGRDLMDPSWDFADRVWMVDRGPQGAEVSYVAGGETFDLDVPGLSGQDVTAFTVSRDGSRLAAVVERSGGSAVVVSRVRRSEAGQVTGATRASQVAWDGDEPLRITDLGWRTTSSLAVVNQLSDLLTEIRTVPVDGSQGSDETTPATDVVLREQIERYVGSPVPGQGPWAVTPAGVMDLSDLDQALVGIDPRVSGLTFVG